MDFYQPISVQMDFSGQGINEITCMHGHLMAPFLCFPWFDHHLFLMVFLSEGKGGGRERRGSVVSSVSLVSLAPPTTVEALHTAGAPALSNGASATELHSNSVPCLPNGAAIGRTSSQALHPEQTETPPTETELPSEQTAGTVKED